MHMNKKWVWIIGGGLLAALLIAGLAIGAGVTLAQEPTPESPATPPKALVPGRGGPGPQEGCGLFGWGHDKEWITLFDTAAEALRLTPEELFKELHSGKTLKEIAKAQGVELDALRQALEAVRTQTLRERIEQAVEDGVLSREQANWMLEGLEKGFFPMGRGMRGHGFERGIGNPRGHWW